MIEGLKTIISSFSGIDVMFFLAGTLPIVFLYRSLFDTRRERKQEEVIVHLERKATSERNEKTAFTEFFATTLRAATERERLTMLRAEASAGRFSFLGTLLLVLSVMAPLISWGVYATLDPLNPSSIAYLKQLRTDTGFVPSGDSISIGRDWHILLAGLSLGFLFVTAARGILRQEAQQRINFLSLGKRVAYYENLAWAIQVYDRLRSETGVVRDASEGILRELIKAPVESTLPQQHDDAPLIQSEQVDAILSALRGTGAKEKV